MAKEFAINFYRSKAWENCRSGYIAHRQSIDGGMCEEGCGGLGFIVHHKVKLTPVNINDALIALGWDNLEYVCKDCHDKIHHEDMHGPSLCSFDEDGQPIPKTPPY